MQIAISQADLKRLVELYTKATPLERASVVPVFPAIGWRYPKLEQGAVVEAVGDGELKKAGLPAHAVLVSANHAPIAALSGPVTTVDVQTDTGTQTFNPQPGIIIIPDPHPKHPGYVPNGPTLMPGGVNVWDRYNGRPGGRDDPSQ